MRIRYRAENMHTQDGPDRVTGEIEWMPLEPRGVRLLLRQLRREIPKQGHPLSGARFAIIAKGASSDDVLLSLHDRGQWAACHMTWSSRRESPPWPATRVADSLAELMTES